MTTATRPDMAVVIGPTEWRWCAHHGWRHDPQGVAPCELCRTAGIAMITRIDRDIGQITVAEHRAERDR